MPGNDKGQSTAVTADGSLVSAEIMAIVSKAGTWDAVGPKYYGMEAPDIIFTDIYGTEHKLSDYRGKEVMLALWATWCPPCNIEVKHLKELTNKLPEDKFKILAISSEIEGEVAVRKFAQQKQLNYTAAWIQHHNLPEPYIFSDILPSAFFIDKEGKIKLITQGLMDTESVEEIVNL